MPEKIGTPQDHKKEEMKICGIGNVGNVREKEKTRALGFAGLVACERGPFMRAWAFHASVGLSCEHASSPID